MHLTMQVTARPGNRRKSRQRRVWMAGLCMLAIVADAQAQGKSKQYVQFDSNMLLRGVSGDSVDLSRFEKPNAVLPGQYRVDVLVNGNWRGLRSWNSATSARMARRLATPPNCCAVRGSTWKNSSVRPSNRASVLGTRPIAAIWRAMCRAQVRFDAAEQQLLLTVPTIYLVRDAPASMWIRPVGQRHHCRAAGLYRQLLFTVRARRTFRRPRLPGLERRAERRLLARAARWLGGGIARRLALSTGPAVRGDRHPVLEIRTAVGRDIFRWAVLRPVSFRGVRVASDERMLPDERRNYVPTIRGTARPMPRSASSAWFPGP